MNRTAEAKCCGFSSRKLPNIRNLRELTLHENDPTKRKRLNAVALLLEERIHRIEIASRTGVPPSTAYAYLHRFRRLGPEGLLNLRSVGRPTLIPKVVRRRFVYLSWPDPDRSNREVLYVAERERLVFRVLGNRFTTRQISRWYTRLAIANNVVDRLRRYRTLRPAYKFLRGPEIERLCFPQPRTTADFKRALRIDVLSYASDLRPKDRELYRRLISATHNIPLTRIWLDGFPGPEEADYACHWVPEERSPENIFAPRPKYEDWFEQGDSNDKAESGPNHEPGKASECPI